MVVFLIKGIRFRIVGYILINMKPSQSAEKPESKKEAMMEVGKPAGWEPKMPATSGGRKKFCPNCGKQMSCKC